MDDINRPPLSPAAWQVASAASVAKDHCKSPIAAALRAAADHIAIESIWHGHSEHTGVRWAAERLRMIAAELESADV